MTHVNQLGGRFLAEVKDNTSRSNSGVNNDESQVHARILAKSWIIVDKEQVIRKVLHRLREKIIPTDDHLALSEEAEQSYDDEVNPGLSHYPESISPSMMMMQDEDRKSLGRCERFSYCGASVGPATTTTTMDRYGSVEANAARNTSQLKMSDELDHSESNTSEIDGRLQQARHAPDHSGPLIPRRSVSSWIEPYQTWGKSQLHENLIKCPLHPWEVSDCSTPDMFPIIWARSIPGILFHLVTVSLS